MTSVIGVASCFYFLPLPIYAIMLVVNYAIFRIRGRKLVKDYQIFNKLSTRFEPRKMLKPPEPPGQ